MRTVLGMVVLSRLVIPLGDKSVPIPRDVVVTPDVALDAEAVGALVGGIREMYVLLNFPINERRSAVNASEIQPIKCLRESCSRSRFIHSVQVAFYI